MSFIADTRKAFEAKLQADWAPSNPTIPIQWENVQFGEPSTGQFIKPALREGKGQIISAMGRCHRFIGTFVIHVFSSEEDPEGLETIMDVVDSLLDTYRGTDGKALELSNGSSGRIECLAPYSQVVGLENAWYGIDAIIPYRRDVIF